MARNIYYSFNELQKIAKELKGEKPEEFSGETYPKGLMGSHFLWAEEINQNTIRCWGFPTVSNLSIKEIVFRVKNCIPLRDNEAPFNTKVGVKPPYIDIRNGETLGYSGGGIWFIQNPNKISCPIKRVMMELKIPKDLLEFVPRNRMDEIKSTLKVTSENLPGCVSFYTGSGIYAEIEDCFITQKYYWRGIDQFQKKNGIYAYEKCDKNKVAEFIKKYW